MFLKPSRQKVANKLQRSPVKLKKTVKQRNEIDSPVFPNTHSFSKFTATEKFHRKADRILTNSVKLFDLAEYFLFNPK